MSVQLSPEIIANLNALEEAHDTIMQEIERAERAGLDMSELRQRLDALETVRQGLVKEYSPPRSRRHSG